jgi:predicted nuclease with TOPRIM domain
MNISNEVVIATVSSFVVAAILKGMDFFIGRDNREDTQDYQTISEYHKSMQEEVSRLREENRRLREESDKYRSLYLELLEKMRTGIE